MSKTYTTPEIKDLIREKRKKNLSSRYAKKPITYGERFRRLSKQVTQAIRTAVKM